jgi:large subunit ribosomal protein L24
VRGRLKLASGFARIEGQIDADSADVTALLAIAAGMPRMRGDGAAWSGEPFAEGMFGDLAGRLDFTAARAVLTPALTARQVRGAVRFGAGELAIEDFEGALAGGRASGHLVLRRGSEGLEARGQFALIGADAATVLPSEGRPVIAGRLGLQAEFDAAGLSAASLIGSLKGAGLVTLEDAQISGLDPKAFNAAIRAADLAAAVDAAKIRDVVSTVLDGGNLAVPRLDAPFMINAGQLRIGQTIVQGQGADLSIWAGADLGDASIEARLTLSGPIIEGTTRPEILVTLKGPLGAVRRNVDVSMLAGFLMLRSVERQSRQIDAIETERRETERRDAERREAERQEAERRAIEARSVPAPVPAALPAPPVPDETTAAPGTDAGRNTRPRPTAPHQRPPATTDRAPALPPPLSIGPAPGSASGSNAKSGQARPAGEAATKGAQPQIMAPLPPPPRSALDVLFGVQR